MCVATTSSILFNRPTECLMLSGGHAFIRFFFTHAMSLFFFLLAFSFVPFFWFFFCMFMTAKDDKF